MLGAQCFTNIGSSLKLISEGVQISDIKEATKLLPTICILQSSESPGLGQLSLIDEVCAFKVISCQMT